MRKLGRVSIPVLALAVCASAALAQEKKKPAAPDEKAMMEAWQKAATPGEMHKKLEPLVGNFDTKVRSWMDPSKPPEDSAGTSTNTWVLGNRYIEQRFEGTAMGEAFSGIGYTGYDNVKKKYVGVWMDSMGTGMMWTTSSPDSSGKTISGKATYDDPMTGKSSTIEEKLTVIDNDHHKFEMWGMAPDGKKFKMLEIDYTRKM